ncbi:hypothetical protein I79_015403 [Cricetulus griseus]|uniref:Uncharacterized protein n=1 Tax=Cricetulus griseus TaxID=10029 RepID=G3HWP2_CRIGR|nr:hypothetical protein I79_015403 [Cricetulus griseus]
MVPYVSETIAIPFPQVNGLVVAGALVLSNHTEDTAFVFQGEGRISGYQPTCCLFVGLAPWDSSSNT